MEETGSTQKQSKDGDSPSKDKLFDPSVELLLNDFDDEQTLEEEEALAAGEAQILMLNCPIFKRYCYFQS
nr:unnamed protein product [Callosobruchus chinensis]